MNKLFSIGFWGWVARFILRNRTAILIVIAGITVLLALQWKNMRFTYTEANLLPDDHPVNLQYDEFLKHFGEEGNLIVVGVKDSTIFTPKKFKAWNQLTKDIGKFSEVELTLSVGNLKKLEKKKDTTGFELVPFIHDSIFTDVNLAGYKDELFNRLPFYDGLIYSPDKKSIRSAIYLKKDIVNTAERKDFVTEDLIPLIKKFEADTGVTVHTSGMPYIRTLNSQSIIDEIGLF
ncbi:MAG: RND family transporter, partial [Aequorivita sp.]|nr:RND family transporter [Aequorivita sp.]